MVATLAITELSLLITGGTIGAIILCIAAGSITLFSYLKEMLLKTRKQDNNIIDFVASLHGLSEQEIDSLKTAAKIARVKPLHQLFISRTIFDHALRVPAVRGQVSTELLAEAREKLFIQKNHSRLPLDQILQETAAST